MIMEQLNRKVALVAEVWYIDKTYYDRMDILMAKCGVQFQRDWTRNKGYDIFNYSIYWLDAQHPLFSILNMVEPLITPTPYWMGDAGDLIKLAPGGKATLLAGLHPKEKSSYGVLASCMEGRMILQTFSTHDYRESNTEMLWQNSIYYTLMNHFNTTQ